MFKVNEVICEWKLIFHSAKCLVDTLLNLLFHCLILFSKKSVADCTKLVKKCHLKKLTNTISCVVYFDDKKARNYSSWLFLSLFSCSFFNFKSSFLSNSLRSRSYKVRCCLLVNVRYICVLDISTCPNQN